MKFKIIKESILNEDDWGFQVGNETPRVITKILDNPKHARNLKANDVKTKKDFKDKPLDKKPENKKPENDNINDDIIEDDYISRIEKSPKNSPSQLKAIDDYLHFLFSTNDFKRIEDAKASIINSIIDDGVRNNPIVKYVKKFLKELPPSFPIYKDYIDLLSQFLGDNVEVEDPNLYKKWLYNEVRDENIYKLKTLIFLNNPRNIRKFGLYKEENGEQVPIRMDDLIGMTAGDIRVFLNKHSSSINDTKTLSDIFEYKDLKSIEKIIAFILKLFTKEGEEKQKQINSKLRDLLRDRNILREFYELEVPNWKSEKDDSLIKPIINTFIENEGIMFGSLRDDSKEAKSTVKTSKKDKSERPKLSTKGVAFSKVLEYFKQNPKTLIPSKRTKNNILIAFEDSYEPDKDLESIIKEIINRLS